MPNDLVEELPDCPGFTVNLRELDRAPAWAPIPAMVCDQVDKKSSLNGCLAELRQEGRLENAVRGWCAHVPSGLGGRILRDHGVQSEDPTA